MKLKSTSSLPSRSIQQPLLNKKQSVVSAQTQQDIADGMDVARGLFSDPRVLLQEINSRQVSKAGGEEGRSGGDLEDMFDGDVLDDQYATKADKAIAETDIPERL